MGPRRPGVLAALAVLLAVRVAAPAAAQTVEVAPMAGYGFGGNLFELATNHHLDIDGAPVFGGAVSVAMDNGLWFEALVTHQQADLDLSAGPYGPPGRIRAVVNHFLAGGRQDFGTGRARPFVTGLVGLTHYGADGDDEIRFTLGAGGGVKVAVAPHLDCGSTAGCTRRSSTWTPRRGARAAARRPERQRRVAGRVHRRRRVRLLIVAG